MKFQQSTNFQEIIALSLNANLHRFDVNNFRPSGLLKLHYQNDNVCLAQESDSNLYAVGSKTACILVDQRHFGIATKIQISQQGIRSLSFHSGVLTIGTGSGALLFYDIRNKKNINFKDTKDQASIKVSKGWLVSISIVTIDDLAKLIYRFLFSSNLC